MPKKMMDTKGFEMLDCVFFSGNRKVVFAVLARLLNPRPMKVKSNGPAAYGKSHVNSLT